MQISHADHISKFIDTEFKENTEIDDLEKIKFKIAFDS